MPEEIDAVCPEHTFARMDFEPRFPQTLEDYLQMFHVFRQRPGPYDDIVDVTPAEGEVAQYLVHFALEVRGSVLQAERND